MSEQEHRDAWAALGVRADVPHPARVYNYLLGGEDNFAADREAAEMSLRYQPEIRDSALGNRRFLRRAVRVMGDAGIRQFLDVGCGLPSSPNTHELVPGARVAYVDLDPVATARARELLADDELTLVVDADLRHTAAVLTAAAELLDFSRPTGLLLVACLHNIPDADDPAGIVARYLPALAPGSYLAISHVTSEFAPGPMSAITEQYAQRGVTFVGRSREAIAGMFNGCDLLDPGVAQISRWRPDAADPDPAPERVWGYAGVARLRPS
jgi:SAM-dependent methyltransferase